MNVPHRRPRSCRDPSPWLYPNFADVEAVDSEAQTAIRIHALAKSLGISKARVVGHDIGLMVAYAYAAQFPSEVEKLV